jgi:hypothetical protein
MPLTFDVSRVKDFMHVTTAPHTRSNPSGEQKWHPVTEALVNLSMVCGFSEITEKNYRTVAKRIAQYQLCFGAQIAAAHWPKIYITEADVRMHIGLRTNVTLISPSQWPQRLVAMMDHDLDRIAGGRANTYSGPVNIIADAKALSAYDICEKLNETVKKDDDNG